MAKGNNVVWHQPRRSDNGRFTTPDYARTHPRTTEVERFTRPAAPPSKPKGK